MMLTLMNVREWNTQESAVWHTIVVGLSVGTGVNIHTGIHDVDCSQGLGDSSCGVKHRHSVLLVSVSDRMMKNPPNIHEVLVAAQRWWSRTSRAAAADCSDKGGKQWPRGLVLSAER